MKPFKELYTTKYIGDANLQAYYRMEGNLDDSSTHGNNAGALNVTFGTQYGKFGSGSFYNGTNSSGSTSSPVMTVVNDFTLMCWVSPATLPSSASQVIIYNGFDNGTTSNGYGLLVSNGSGGGGSVLTALFGNVTWMNTGYTFPSANVFYHIALIRRSGTTFFYVNGQQTITTFPTTTPATPTVQTTFGGQIMPRYFSGSIDDAAFFDRALSHYEVMDIYNTTVATYGEYIPNNFTKGYWRLNGTGTDYSDKGNNAMYVVNGTITSPTDDIFLGNGRFSEGVKLNNNPQSNRRYLRIIHNNTELDTSVTNWTLGAWVRPASLPTVSAVVILIKNNGNSFGQSLGLDTVVTFNSGFNAVAVTLSPSVVGYAARGDKIRAEVGKWYHLLSVFDNTAKTVTLYVNATLIQTTATGANLRNGTNPSLIGDYDDNITLNQFFDGVVDEAFMENRVWTGEMARNYYNQAQGRYAPRLV